MQALPYATQLLARLGAEVVKVEHPKGGDSGPGLAAGHDRPGGPHRSGATFLRNNLDKRSICIDLKSPAGRDLVLAAGRRGSTSSPRTSRPARWTASAWATTTSRPCTPASIYLSVSGFGQHRSPSPYDSWPAFAADRRGHVGHLRVQAARATRPPLVAPVGALGDIGSALFAVIGVLAALRHRDATGQGQHVDIAMFDAMVAMTDLVTNFWSLGLRGGRLAPLIMHGFRAADGWFIVQVGREHQFAALAELVGQPGVGRRPALRRAARAGSTTSTT